MDRILGGECNRFDLLLLMKKLDEIVPTPEYWARVNVRQRQSPRAERPFGVDVGRVGGSGDYIQFNPWTDNCINSIEAWHWQRHRTPGFACPDSVPPRRPTGSDGWELSQDYVVCYINVRVNCERPYKIPEMPKIPPAWVVNAAIRDEVSYQAFYGKNPQFKEPVQLEKEIIREVPGATEVDTVLWNIPIRPEAWLAASHRPKGDQLPRPSDVRAAWTDEDCITAREMGWWQALAADGKTDDDNECREKPPFYNAPTTDEVENLLGPRSGEKLEDMYREWREFQEGRREDCDPHGWFEDGVSFNDETCPAEVTSQPHIPSPSFTPPDSPGRALHRADDEDEPTVDIDTPAGVFSLTVDRDSPVRPAVDSGATAVVTFTGYVRDVIAALSRMTNSARAALRSAFEGHGLSHRAYRVLLDLLDELTLVCRGCDSGETEVRTRIRSWFAMAAREMQSDVVQLQVQPPSKKVEHQAGQPVPLPVGAVLKAVKEMTGKEYTPEEFTRLFAPSAPTRKASSVVTRPSTEEKAKEMEEKDKAACAGPVDKTLREPAKAGTVEEDAAVSKKDEVMAPKGTEEAKKREPSNVRKNASAGGYGPAEKQPRRDPRGRYAAKKPAVKPNAASSDSTVPCSRLTIAEA